MIPEKKSSFRMRLILIRFCDKARNKGRRKNEGIESREQKASSTWISAMLMPFYFLELLFSRMKIYAFLTLHFSSAHARDA